MSFLQQYFPVDNPNVPLLSAIPGHDKPIGKFVQPADFYEDLYDIKEYAKVQLQDLYLPNVSIRTYQGKFDRDSVLINKRGDGTDYIGSCFFLEGGMTTFTQSCKKSEIYKGMHNLKYDPYNELAHACSAESPFHLVHIALSTKFFLETLPEDESWADVLRTNILKRKLIFKERPAFITVDQYKALQNIIDCQVGGQLGHFMMETYVSQIMLLQLHGLFQKEDCKQGKLSKRDQDLMQEVKTYLSTFFLCDHSLTSLAKYFGVNTNKLMTLFKSLFGVSIFEYINELKMNHANQLLLDGFTVSEVATKIGYKNPHHFSVAFKKKFGISPSIVKEAA